MKESTLKKGIILRESVFNTSIIEHVKLMLPSFYTYIYYFEKNSVAINGKTIKELGLYLNPIFSEAVKYNIKQTKDCWGVIMPLNAPGRLKITPKQALINLTNYYPEATNNILSKKIATEKLNTLIQFLNNFSYDKNSIVQDVGEHIIQKKGIVKVNELAKKFNCSTRFIQKEFASNVGVATKQYTRNIRFIYALVNYMGKKPWKAKTYHHFTHFKKDWDAVIKTPFTEKTYQILLN